jgi:hypothetical protein
MAESVTLPDAGMNAATMLSVRGLVRLAAGVTNGVWRICSMPTVSLGARV